MRDRPQPFDSEHASTIAALALAFLATEPGRLASFLDQSGMTPAALMASAGGRETDVAILDHLMADDSLLLAFAAHARIAAEDVARAHTILSR